MHSFTHTIAFGHIIVFPAHTYVRDVTSAIDEQWQSMGRQKRSELHHRGEFLHNYYTFESVHKDDHDSGVKIFVGLSCEL